MRYPISETNMEREETQRNIFGRRMTKDLWEYVALIPGLSRCFTVPLAHIGLAEKTESSSTTRAFSPQNDHLGIP